MRSVSATADFTEIRDVARVTISPDPANAVTLLFDPDHDLHQRHARKHLRPCDAARRGTTKWYDRTDARRATLCCGTRRDNLRGRGRRGGTARGETIPQHVLTEGQVRVIKQRLGAGETQTAIAVDFPVSRVTIGNIARGIRWSHVREYPA